jgi:hypothetical protein
MLIGRGRAESHRKFLFGALRESQPPITRRFALP